MKLYIPLLKFMGMKFSGVPRYIGKDVKFDKFSNIQLGNRVVISNDCFLLTHDYSITSALISINEKPNTDIALERPITIGNNVFIGMRTIVMPNTVIEDNVIIGANSVVRGHIKENSIAFGNPCIIVGNIQEQAYKCKKYFDSDKIRID